MGDGFAVRWSPPHLQFHPIYANPRFICQSNVVNATACASMIEYPSSAPQFLGMFKDLVAMPLFEQLRIVR